MKERHLTPREGAACVLSVLQRRGAVFTITPDGYLHCDLDPADLSGDGMTATVDDIARIMLALREEIKELLRDRTVH